MKHILENIVPELNKLIKSPGPGDWNLHKSLRCFFACRYAECIWQGEQVLVKAIMYVSLSTDELTAHVCRDVSVIAECTVAESPMLGIALSYHDLKSGLRAMCSEYRNIKEFPHLLYVPTDMPSATFKDWTFTASRQLGYNPEHVWVLD